MTGDAGYKGLSTTSNLEYCSFMPNSVCDQASNFDSIDLSLMLSSNVMKLFFLEELT